VTDIDVDPFSIDTERHDGSAAPARPDSLSIWDASVQGRGTQALDWDRRPGDWSVVVMNADGSAGVGTEMTFGARVSFLFEIALGLVIGGALLFAGSIAMIVAGARKPPAGPASELAPAAG
jgi:hypothetical protein